jgi:hypothetical protein
MTACEVKFCSQCGKGDLAAQNITPNHMVEVYCPHCGLLTVLVLLEHELVGHAVVHDPDSDSESW